MNITFRLLYRQTLRSSFKNGEITEDQYAILMDALRHPVRRRKLGNTDVDLMDEIEKYVSSNVPKTGNFLIAIVVWLKDHWVDILKFLLTLLVLLDEPK